MSVSVNINYAGKRAAGYIAGAIANGVMITGGHITTLWGVKNAINLPVMKVDNIIVPYSVDFAEAGDVEVTDKTLDPKTLSVMISISIPTLNALYESEMMREGYSNTVVPMSYEDFLIKYIQKIVANQMDNYIWNSDTALTGTAKGQIDGLLKQISRTSGIITVPGTTLTKANILEELGKVYTATPESLGDSSNSFRIFVSKKTAKLIRLVLFDMVGKDVKDSNKLPFDPDSIIVTVPNFPNDVMVGACVENLFFAADAESDMSTVNIIDMRKTTGDDKYRFRMDFKLDAKIGFEDEIVYYAY
jgi:hypothetical protein